MTVRGAAGTAADAAAVATTTVTAENIVPGRTTITAATSNGSYCGGGDRRNGSTRDPVGRENWRLAQHGANNTATEGSCRISSAGRCCSRYCDKMRERV